MTDFVILKREQIEEEERRKHYTKVLKKKHTCKRCKKIFYDFVTNTIKDDFCAKCVTEALGLLQKEKSE